MKYYILSISWFPNDEIPNIFICILTCHVEDAITGIDVGQEGISQALASMSTFHQTGNVNNTKKSWDFAVTKEAIK